MFHNIMHLRITDIVRSVMRLQLQKMNIFKHEHMISMLF